MNDHAVASQLARGAMERLLSLRQTFVSEQRDPAEWGPTADAAANAWLLGRLADLRPDDVVLSEEAPDPQVRLSASRVWIIDPLDGTSEFAQAGRTDWAVHVALSVDGEPVVGAVALPDGMCWATEPTPVPVPAPDGSPLRMVVSRSRAPQLCHDVAARIGAEVVPLGSAGAKVAAVLAGHADLYLHAGGMRQWDSCAPVAVALAAGLHASRIDGSALRFNGADVNLPDLLVCRAELAEPALAAVAASVTGPA
ncbi:MAG: 3'(2'),5'-bisphosphate nucleotidase CysQ [Acidimicrobiia bacterium]